MRYKASFLLFLVFTMAFHNLFAAKVGLLITATGKYDRFVDPLITSARKHFCLSHEVTYFVFTDGGKITTASDTVITMQQRRGWPYDSMLRNAIYYENKDLFSEQDYLFAVDADMLFYSAVGEEIFGERVATLHPHYVDKRGTYETNPYSLAYVKEGEGTHYFAGGFFGGTRDEFVKIIGEVSRRINNDLSRDITSVWHDESHWNRFCIDVPPTVILDSSYCWPDYWGRRKGPKLLCLSKNSGKLRKGG